MTHWKALRDEMLSRHGDIATGKMMSSEALTFGGKVFAFYSAKGAGVGLGVRLGRDYPFERLPLTTWSHLAPFKTKPPMRDWILVGADDVERWRDLAEEALRVARG